MHQSDMSWYVRATAPCSSDFMYSVGVILFQFEVVITALWVVVQLTFSSSRRHTLINVLTVSHVLKFSDGCRNYYNICDGARNIVYWHRCLHLQMLWYEHRHVRRWCFSAFGRRVFFVRTQSESTKHISMIVQLD